MAMWIQTLPSNLRPGSEALDSPHWPASFMNLSPMSGFPWKGLEWESSSNGSKPCFSDSAITFPFYWRQARIGRLSDIWARAGKEHASPTSMSWASVRHLRSCCCHALPLQSGPPNSQGLRFLLGSIYECLVFPFLSFCLF